jgi:uncharacterized Ntn-hydrolase superfamily protein
MTWSIVAKDRETGLFGLAIASRFFAVGALCPWAEGGVGAVCTQAMMNPSLGPRGLALLREGLHAPDVRDILIAGDKGRARRQLHLIDAAGRTAAHTGESCTDWCGQLARDGLSVAGNMLAGPEVVAETVAAYEVNVKQPIVERLIAAMKAGEVAGGDKRGKQSAALLIQGEEPYPRLSLRVDDHPDPLAELIRHYEVAKENFIPFSTAFPRPERPYGITDRAFLETIVEREAGKPLAGEMPVPERQRNS